MHAACSSTSIRNQDSENKETGKVAVDSLPAAKKDWKTANTLLLLSSVVLKTITYSAVFVKMHENESNRVAPEAMERDYTSGFMG